MSPPGKTDAEAAAAPAAHHPWLAALRLPRRSLRARTRWLMRLPVLVMLALLIGFTWFLAGAAIGPPMGAAAPDRHTDGIAVLTGGADRVETGLRMLRAGLADRLLISGVHRDVTLADLVPRSELAEGGLAQRIGIGHAATSTRGNALEIAAWARETGLGSLRIVTAGYHMPRALLELRRALPGVELVPHPVVPAQLRDPGAAAVARTWSLLAGEYLKYLGAAAGLSAGLSPAGPDRTAP